MSDQPKLPVENNGVTTPKQRGGCTGRGFKPGRSGNPGGRPRKLTRKLEMQLDQRHPHPSDVLQLFPHLSPAQRAKVTTADVLIAAGIIRAVKRSDQLFKEIYERVEGKVPEPPEEPEYDEIVVRVRRVGRDTE